MFACCPFLLLAARAPPKLRESRAHFGLQFPLAATSTNFLSHRIATLVHSCFIQLLTESSILQKMIRRKKNVKKGIQFCLMVCGASGTGKFDLPRSFTVPGPALVLHPTYCRQLLTCFPISFHIGRTTFVNTLCGKSVLGHKESDDPTGAHVEDGVKIKPYTVGTKCRY